MYTTKESWSRETDTNGGRMSPAEFARLSQRGVLPEPMPTHKSDETKRTPRGRD